jgi:TRAP-type C4-dicarboxylate transport system substrate-binding protein
MSSHPIVYRRLPVLLVVAASLIAGTALFPDPAAAEDSEGHVLKVASLAPEGSSWAKAFERMARKIEKKTDGAVELEIYPGGIMGDEPAMVRKMRTGQLDGAALTNVGLGKIEPKVLTLQLPLLFKSWDEVDYVREEMDDTFSSMLEDNGFTLLSWGDVGFNYLFSSEPVRVPSDIQSQKAWVWESDPIMRAVMDVADVNAVPLKVTDVLPSLSTGVIDAFTNSPYGAVSLQWYSRADYVTNMKLNVIVGGIVMSTDSLEELSDEHRKVVREVAAEGGEELLDQIREDNRKAIGTIQEAGVENVEPKKMEKWQELADETKAELKGDLYPASLIETIEKHLEDYRE